MGTVVRGSGFAVGEHLIKNERLARACETTDEWIRERSGIEQRYYVKDGTTTSDLGVRAAKSAIENAGLEPKDIDYVVFATMTPDYQFPGCGVLLQNKLGLPTVPTLDIRQQCTGFIYGLQVADALLRAGQARRLLLVGAECHSPYMPWRDWDAVLGDTARRVPDDEYTFSTRYRDRTVLFGDAGGAVVLEHDGDPSRGLLATKLHSDGAYAEKLYVPSGFAWRPYITEAMVREGRHIPEMDGRQVFRMAVTKMPEVVNQLLREQGYAVSDISLLIAHQANLRINEAVQKSLGLTDDRVYNNIQKYGNTTAATIPIAYDECRRAGRIKRGDLICFVGLGAGFHWGAALLRE
jgi:3-oxoacyl-[acyl-carrier-protein] synthase-3